MEKIPERVAVGLAGIVAGLSITAWATDREDAGSSAPFAQETTIPLRLTGVQESSVIQVIEGEIDVAEAAITQNGRDLGLVIIVLPNITRERARQLGENFVRLVKTIGPDKPPGSQIGIGFYDYLIGIYYPDGSTIALGAKVRSSPDITW